MIPAVPLALGCFVLLALWRRAETRARRAVAAASAAHAARDSAERTARLAARDLRDLALRLLGQAAAGASAAPGARASLAAVAERCRTLADDLGAVGPQPDAVHLTEDTFDLLACAREAVAATSATLAPGRRQFRLPPRVPGTDPGVWIWADPRAIREVLGRVLAEAVLNTREDDSIILSLRDSADAVTLTVADEGLGLAGPAGDATATGPVQRDCRGIGAPLALARNLLEAHGGRLEVIAAARAGTRVSLVFPVARRRRAVGPVVSSPASLTQALAATLPS